MVTNLEIEHPLTPHVRQKWIICFVKFERYHVIYPFCLLSRQSKVMWSYKNNIFLLLSKISKKESLAINSTNAPLHVLYFSNWQWDISSFLQHSRLFLDLLLPLLTRFCRLLKGGKISRFETTSSLFIVVFCCYGHLIFARDKSLLIRK